MDETKERPSKKKRRSEDSWKKSKTKKMRNSGEEYVSLHAKKVIPKKMSPSEVSLVQTSTCLHRRKNINY